jgi:hypothetical protein
LLPDCDQPLYQIKKRGGIEGHIEELLFTVVNAELQLYFSAVGTEVSGYGDHSLGAASGPIILFEPCGRPFYRSHCQPKPSAAPPR